MAAELTTELTTASRQLSRRGVVRAMVWTVPAVTLATAAPAFAGSGVTQEFRLFFNAGGGTDRVWAGIELSPGAIEGAVASVVSPPVQFLLQISDVWTGVAELRATRLEGSNEGDWEFFAVEGATHTEEGAQSTSGSLFGVLYRGGHRSGDSEGVTYLRIEIRGYDADDEIVPAGNGTVTLAPATELTPPWATPEIESRPVFSGGVG